MAGVLLAMPCPRVVLVVSPVRACGGLAFLGSVAGAGGGAAAGGCLDRKSVV